MRGALEAGFDVGIDFELMYDRKVWLWAKKNNKLEARSVGSVVPAELTQRVLLGDTELRDHLDDEWAIFVLHKFSQRAKSQVARYICEWDEREFKIRMKEFQPLVSEIATYLTRD